MYVVITGLFSTSGLDFIHQLDDNVILVESNIFRNNHRIAEKLHIICSGHEVDIIAHSNGTAIAYLAAQMGTKISKLYLFSSILSEYVEFPPNIKQIYNIYHPNDLVLRLGRLIFKGMYGVLGLFGHQGICDSRITNVNAKDIHEYNSWINPHSDYYHKKNVKKWVKFIKNA